MLAFLRLRCSSRNISDVPSSGGGIKEEGVGDGGGPEGAAGAEERVRGEGGERLEKHGGPAKTSPRGRGKHYFQLGLDPPLLSLLS